MVKIARNNGKIGRAASGKVGTCPCCGGGGPGFCCVNAPGNGMTWGTGSASIRVNDTTSLQLNKVALADLPTGTACGLVDGTFTPTGTLDVVTANTSVCLQSGASTRSRQSQNWNVILGTQTPPFFAKQDGHKFTIRSDRWWTFKPSHLWPNGVVTPYFWIQSTISVTPDWMIEGGNGEDQFASWTGTATANTKMPVDASHIVYNDPSGYTGLQMEGSVSVSHDAGCQAGVYPWPMTTNSVTGGVYYTPGLQTLQFRFAWTGVQELPQSYPNFGSTVFDSYVRLYNNNSIGTGTFAPMVLCNTFGALT